MCRHLMTAVVLAVTALAAVARSEPLRILPEKLDGGPTAEIVRHRCETLSCVRVLFSDSPLKRHGEFPSLSGAGLEAAVVPLCQDTDPPFRLLDRYHGIRPAEAAIDREEGLPDQLPVLGQVGFHDEIGVGVRATHANDLPPIGGDGNLHPHPGCLKQCAFYQTCPRRLAALGNDRGEPAIGDRVPAAEGHRDSLRLDHADVHVLAIRRVDRHCNSVKRFGSPDGQQPDAFDKSFVRCISGKDCHEHVASLLAHAPADDVRQRGAPVRIVVIALTPKAKGWIPDMVIRA